MRAVIVGDQLGKHCDMGEQRMLGAWLNENSITF